MIIEKIIRLIHCSVFVLILSIVSSENALSGVNTRNGNFYIAYTDVSLPGEKELSVIRTYNSKCVEKGMFGFGWGTDYETRLMILGDGSVLIRENLCGSRSRYYQSNQDRTQSARNSAEKIVSVLVRTGDIDGNSANAETEKLTRNAESRASRWNNLVAAGLLEQPFIPNNIRFTSYDLGKNFVIKTSFGFIRIKANQQEYFDEAGWLIQRNFKNGSVLYIHRNEQGLIQKIATDDGRSLFFTFYSNGLVKKIRPSTSKKSAFYKYSGSDLVETRDVGGNVFKHLYDSNHNMIEIQYIDNSKMQIQYNERQFAAKIIQRDFSVTEYNYLDNNEIPSEYVPEDYELNEDYAYGTIVSKRESENAPPFSRSERWYFLESLSGGKTYTRRQVTGQNGYLRLTDYHPCGTPIAIDNLEGQRTEFEITDDCLMTQKDDGETIIDIAYHSKLRKITRVTKSYKQTGEKFDDVEFKYDDDANLVYARNQDGEFCELVYDKQQRVKQMKSNDNLIIDFEYNDLGKPTMIAIVGEGKINVTYDQSGEIESVESDEGHDMALKITSAFQNLLALVKPAGVDLGL